MVLVAGYRGFRVPNDRMHEASRRYVTPKGTFLRFPLALPCVPCHCCAMPHSGTVIREARKARKLSLRDLATLAEVDYSTLSKVERGLVEPSPRWLKAVTDALGKHMAGAA